MKKASRIIAFILTFALLFSICAFAAEARSSAYFVAYNGALSKASTGKMLISFDVTGTGTMTYLGASTIKVYKSNGTLMKTYKYTDAGCYSMMGYSTYVHSGSLTYSGTTGQSYYCVITFYARNSSGQDSRTYTTSTFTLT